VESREAAERFEKAEELAEKRESFGKRTAVLVAVLAAMLALAGLGANRAQEEVLLAQVQASDTWNEYQANSLKKHINADTAVVLTKQGFADEAKKLIDANNTKYIPNQDKLMPKAQGLEHERDIAHERHNSYQIAEAAFQLGIVLCSIAIVARALWLVFVGVGLGAVGLLALLNGFMLFIKLGH
jgi:ABC-type nickel/cobalt efflux system permease component RcnA